MKDRLTQMKRKDLIKSLTSERYVLNDELLNRDGQAYLDFCKRHFKKQLTELFSLYDSIGLKVLSNVHLTENNLVLSNEFVTYKNDKTIVRKVLYFEFIVVTK